MNTQNGLKTDMVKNGHCIGPRVVRADPCVVRGAKAVLARTQARLGLCSMINNYYYWTRNVILI